MTAAQPPAAPLAPKTDEETVNAHIEALRQALAARPPASDQEFVQAVGAFIYRAIVQERKRAVALLNEKAHKAAAASEVAAAGGAPPHEVAGPRHAAAALARCAQLLAQPPGALACPACGGRKFVLSSVVTASGAPRALPCPRCATPAPAAVMTAQVAPAAPAPAAEPTLPPSPERPGLALVPPTATPEPPP
jgi:hypothetical protein